MSLTGSSFVSTSTWLLIPRNFHGPSPNFGEIDGNLPEPHILCVPSGWGVFLPGRAIGNELRRFGQHPFAPMRRCQRSKVDNVWQPVHPHCTPMIEIERIDSRNGPYFKPEITFFQGPSFWVIYDVSFWGV